jgi:cell division protein FtsB
MRELRRKQKIKRMLYSFPSLIVLSIITFFLVKGAWGVMEKERKSKEIVKDLKGEVATLIQRERELKDDISRLETNEGVKEEIKKRFNVAQEGEYVAVIVDNQKVSTSTDHSLWSWYKKLWVAIMGDK